VEELLFKIPTAVFNDSVSPEFDLLFSASEFGGPSGMEDEHPLKLKGLTAEELRLFVRAASAQ
jgi:hypothetical protein